MAFTTKVSKKEKEILKNFEQLTRKLGFKISKAKLNFAGLNLKGGICILENETWLVFDRNMNFEKQLDIFKQALNTAETAKMNNLTQEEKNFMNTHINEDDPIFT